MMSIDLSPFDNKTEKEVQVARNSQSALQNTGQMHQREVR